MFDTPRNELIRFAAVAVRSDLDAVTAINAVVDGGAQHEAGTLGRAMWEYLHGLSDYALTRLVRAVERAAK